MSYLRPGNIDGVKHSWAILALLVKRRLLLSTLAYTLPAALRRIALNNTELAHATGATIRLKLVKIGAVVIRNTRRIRLLLGSHYPGQSLFHTLCQKLCPS